MSIKVFVMTFLSVLPETIIHLKCIVILQVSRAVLPYCSAQFVFKTAARRLRRVYGLHAEATITAAQLLPVA